jgi:protein associated with RNAse G/E
MTDIRVVFSKYDGSRHWHETMRLLGTDEHGTWLGSSAGVQIQRGDEPPITLPQAHVYLIPAAGVWWTVVFNDDRDPHVEVYCDICTVPVRTGDEITMVDLDLDVIRRWDGTVEIVDEDEFELHQVKYGYSAEVVSSARAAADELAEIIRSGVEPFGSVYKGWLAKV